MKLSTLTLNCGNKGIVEVADSWMVVRWWWYGRKKGRGRPVSVLVYKRERAPQNDGKRYQTTVNYTRNYYAASSLSMSYWVSIFSS